MSLLWRKKLVIENRQYILMDQNEMETEGALGLRISLISLAMFYYPHHMIPRN